MLEDANVDVTCDAKERFRSSKWLNRTVLGIGLASLFSDWSHEIATTVLPAFLATMGVAAAWLGLIEGVSDGLSSFAKMASGFYTDKLPRRKPIAVIGYLVTAFGTAAFGLAAAAWHILIARAFAWFGRGVRTPVRKALLAGSVTRQTYGSAFGFERMMDTLGAIVGPATAFVLLQALGYRYPLLFALTLVPSLTAVALIAFVVKEKERQPVPHVSFGQQLRKIAHELSEVRTGSRVVRCRSVRAHSADSAGRGEALRPSWDRPGPQALRSRFTCCITCFTPALLSQGAGSATAFPETGCWPWATRCPPSCRCALCSCRRTSAHWRWSSFWVGRISRSKRHLKIRFAPN